MSRIGRKPIVIPAGVTVTVDEAAHTVAVKGPKGSLNSNYHPLMTVKVEGNEVLVTRPNDENLAKSLHGLTRTNIANMVNGVVNGYSKDMEIYSKDMEIVGVGLRCQKQGSNLVMNLGFSHQVIISDTDDIKIEWKDPNNFTITGIDKQKVGQFAAEVRAKKPPSRTRARASATRARSSSTRKAKPARARNKVRSERQWLSRSTRTKPVFVVIAAFAARSAAPPLVLAWMFSAPPSTFTLRSLTMKRA